MLHVTKNIQPEFTDERGDITAILDDGIVNIRSTLIITSKKGAVRANHYHKEDSHYCYLLSGKMKYFEKAIDAPDSEMEEVVLETGDMIFSPPMRAHAMEFLEDTVWVVLATKSRKDGAYEHDTVRVKVI